MLSLGVVYPLPEDWLVAELRNLDMVVVVEELSPYLEDQIRALCTLHGLHTKILGKRTGHLPVEGEYRPEIIRTMLWDAFGIGSPVRPAPPELRVLPQRAPTLCASCPHRSAFFAARSVFGDEALYFNDIGCYTLGVAPPLNVGDALLSMGAGFTLAAGIARTTGERTLGFLGDSTFFHSGMPALLNAIKEDVNMVAVIMDNEVTAMTGFQESPGIEVEADGLRRKVDIEAIVLALGARHVETIDPNDLAESVAAFERAKQRDELSVVISHRACPIFLDQAVGHADAVASTKITTYAIDHDRCQYCGRSSCGQRCEQGVVQGFERVMARARSLEIGDEIDRPLVAPCATACPLYLCIQGYAAHIAAGRYEDALELIMSGLPLPDSVCRVCDRPCEIVCVRAGVDEPVAINDLKRFVMDWADAQEEFPYRPNVEAANGKQVAVVGAGPAGLAASHELAMRGYAVRLYDSNTEPGGLLREGIPEYRLPVDVLNRDIQRILDLGVSFEGRRRLGAGLELDDLLEANDAVLLAIGGGADNTLELPGTGPELISALAYLGDEVGSSGRVLVVGGGNSAVDSARTALRRGGVQVLKEQKVGPYDSVVIQGNSGAELIKWLNDNQYAQPAETESLIDVYAKQDYVFLALKLQKNKSAGDIAPIVVTHEADDVDIVTEVIAEIRVTNMEVRCGRVPRRTQEVSHRARTAFAIALGELGGHAEGGSEENRGVRPRRTLVEPVHRAVCKGQRNIGRTEVPLPASHGVSCPRRVVREL